MSTTSTASATTATLSATSCCVSAGRLTRQGLEGSLNHLSSSSAPAPASFLEPALFVRAAFLVGILTPCFAKQIDSAVGSALPQVSTCSSFVAKLPGSPSIPSKRFGLQTVNGSVYPRASTASFPLLRVPDLLDVYISCQYQLSRRTHLALDTYVPIVINLSRRRYVPSVLTDRSWKMKKMPFSPASSRKVNAFVCRAPIKLGRARPSPSVSLAHGMRSV